MLLGAHRFSDYRTLEFPLYSDSHLSSKKLLLVMEEEKRNMRKNKVQMKAANI